MTSGHHRRTGHAAVRHRIVIAIGTAILTVAYLNWHSMVSPAYCNVFQCGNTNPVNKLWLPMELQQYLQFRKTNDGFDSYIHFNKTPEFRPAPDISKYVYTTIRLLQLTTPTTVVLRVRETRDGVRTRGGGCLYGEVDSGLWRGVCSFRDSFDGDYVIWCRRPAAGCTDVMVQVQCVDFGAYSSVHGALHRTIWRKTICSDKSRTLSEWSTRSARLLATLEREATVKNAVRWRRQTLHDAWSPSELLELHTDSLKEQLCRCVKRFDQVLLVGASHMRFKFDFIADLCLSAQLGLYHASCHIDNVGYERISLINDLESIRDAVLRYNNASLTRDSLVIIQSGAHDLVFRGLPSTMQTTVDRFVDILRELKEMSDRVGFRLILQMTPPSPDVVLYPTKGGRNNFAIAAFVQLLTLRLKKLNIDIFDEFNALLRMQYDHVCKHHYLCRVQRARKIVPVGNSGQRVLLLQMSKICGLS